MQSCTQQAIQSRHWASIFKDQSILEFLRWDWPRYVRVAFFYVRVLISGLWLPCGDRWNNPFGLNRVPTPFLFRVSLCTRGHASRSPSWQRSGTDSVFTSSSVTWLPSKDCRMETSSIRNQVINVHLHRVFFYWLICFVCDAAAKHQIYDSHQAVRIHENLDSDSYAQNSCLKPH